MIKEIRTIFQNEIDDKIIHGGVAMAGRNGSVYCEVSSGFTTPEHRYAMNSDTVLDVASTTKAAAVVTALLICRSRGMIDFDAPFTEYLPDYSAPLRGEITIRDLVNHLSGFGDVPGQKQRLYFDESGKQMLANMLTIPPPHPVTRYAYYSCWNYILLGLIIERITGERFDSFCEREIFAPLEMDSTSLGRVKPDVGIERLGQTCGTERPGEISDFVAKRIYRDGGCTGNAGLFTSANDFVKLLECYLNKGVTSSGNNLFGEAELREIMPDRCGHFDGYRRFGWVIYENILPEDMYGMVLFHSGWSGQTILFDLSRKLYALVLTTRCGDYTRAKRDRFEILQRLWRMSFCS